LAKTPPCSHQGQHPLFVARKVLQEHGRVQNQVAARAKAEQRNEEPQSWPVWHSTCDNGGNGAENKRKVECVFATDDIGTETPEQGANEHSSIDSDRHASFEALLSKLGKGLPSNDGLQKQDKRIDRISGDK